MSGLTADELAAFRASITVDLSGCIAGEVVVIPIKYAANDVVDSITKGAEAAGFEWTIVRDEENAQVRVTLK